MRVIKKNVYYCDHCKKRGMSGGHMKRHESRCTNNPERVCYACERKSIREIVEKFKARYTLTLVDFDDEYERGKDYVPEWIGDPVTLNEIREAVDNCPNCILSVVRQCKFNHHYFTDFEKFDYKKELSEFMLHRPYPDPY